MLLVHGSFARPRAKLCNDDKDINVLGTVAANLSSSCRQIEQELCMPKSSVHKILQKHRFKRYYYFITYIPVTNSVEFCHWHLHNDQVGIIFHREIIWSYKAHFISDGILSGKNNRYYLVSRKSIGYISLNLNLLCSAL